MDERIAILNYTLSVLTVSSIETTATVLCSSDLNPSGDLVLPVMFIAGVLEYCSPQYVLLLLRLLGRLCVLQRAQQSPHYALVSLLSHSYEFGSQDTRLQIVKLVEEWSRGNSEHQPLDSTVLQGILKRLRWVGDFSRVSEVENCVRNLRYLARRKLVISDDTGLDELLSQLRTSYEFVDKFNSSIV